MATEIRVPTLGESVSEATVGTWFKKVGDTVSVPAPSGDRTYEILDVKYG